MATVYLEHAAEHTRRWIAGVGRAAGVEPRVTVGRRILWVTLEELAEITATLQGLADRFKGRSGNPRLARRVPDRSAVRRRPRRRLQGGPQSRAGAMNVMRMPVFRRLAIGWTFSNLGDSVLYLTLAIWVKDITDSNAAAGLVFLFLGLPVLVAPLAGQIADRRSRRRLAIYANLVEAVVVIMLVFVDGRSDVWIIYAVTFAYGCLDVRHQRGQVGASCAICSTTINSPAATGC